MSAQHSGATLAAPEGTGTYLDRMQGGLLDEVEEYEVRPGSKDRSTLLQRTNQDDLDAIYARVREYRETKRKEKNAKAADAAGAESAKAMRPFIPRQAVAMSDPASAPGKPGATAKRLLGQGWEVTIMTCRILMPAVRFVGSSAEGAENPHEAGDIRTPRHAVRTYQMVACKRANNGRVGLVIQAGWERRAKSIAFTGAHTFDPWLGRLWRPGMLSARPQNQIEAEEGISPPASFDDWLHAVAPTAQSKATRKRRAAKAAADS